MTEPSIEFEPAPENSEEKVRRYFRIHLAVPGAVRTHIRSHSYPVSDISQEGIGILCRHSNTFRVGEVVTECRLSLPDETVLSGLTGKVIHCTARDDDLWLYGIQWADMDAQSRNILEQTMMRMKKQALIPEDLPGQKDTFPDNE